MTGPKPSESGMPLDATLRRPEQAASANSDSAAKSPAPEQAKGSALPPVLDEEPRTDAAPAPIPAKPPLRPVGPGPLPRFPTDPGGIPVAKGKETKAPEEKLLTNAPSSWTPEKTARGAELATGKAAVGEYPTGEEAARNGGQVPWSEGQARPVPESGVEELETAAQRPMAEVGIEDLPTSAMLRRLPKQDVGKEELDTAAMPAFKGKDAEDTPVEELPTSAQKARPAPELDEEPVTQATPQRKVNTKQAIPNPTAANPYSTGARPLLNPDDQDDAEKKRDRMTAMMVLAVGLPLIFVVYLVTRYEPAPPPERAHVFKTPEFKQNSGGASHRGGGGAGMKKGGPSLEAKDRPIIAIGHDCVSKCAEKQLGCSASCKAGEKCREHCLDRARSCENSCTGEKATIGNEMLDCLTETGEPRKCTAADRAQEQAQAKAVRMLCKNSEGDVVPCADQVAKIEKGKQLMEKQCGPGGKNCLGSEP